MEIDYKKEYEAMVQRARELHETGNELTKRQMEIVCQELRESEDERIRREIIDFICQKIDRGSVTKEQREKSNSWLAYLEKQKEPENVSATTMAPSCWDVEQKEQKPLITGNDFGWIDELKHDLEHPEELDEKVQEVLKKRQKPVDRSLEDDHIIGFVYDLLNEIEWKDNWAMSKEECLRRLKSLRPSWKPSEEQMIILSWAANGMVDKSIAAPEMRAVLRELYEQLKRL